MSEQNQQIKEEPQEKSFFGVIIHSFFIIPFLIAVFSVLLFASFRLLTMEKQTVFDLLEDVKVGGATKRWQAAFELSKILANPELIPHDPRFNSELVSAFEHSLHDDSRVRQYLALAIGRTGNKSFVGTLVTNLENEGQENLYADRSAIGRLKGVLMDEEPNVQWDAAIALAKLKSAEGKHILLKLLNRQYISQFSEVDKQEQDHIMVSVIEAAAYLDDSELSEAITKLAQTDQNMKVRSAAYKFLKK